MSGYERSDAHVGRIVVFAVVLTVVVTLVVFGVGAMVRGLIAGAEARDPEPHARAVDEPVPGPRLQANPPLELQEHRAMEARRTGEYAWIDRASGRVRIPVERAMELIAERGLPVRPPRGEGR